MQFVLFSLTISAKKREMSHGSFLSSNFITFKLDLTSNMHPKEKGKKNLYKILQER